MKSKRILLSAALAALLAPALHASVVTQSDPQAGGIGYQWTATLGATDTASFQRHVGAWSWEDNSLFGDGDDPVGWTHTSDWVAVTLTAPTTLKLRLERQAGVPWPSGGNPNRVASTASMFPCFTLWSGWDNDLMPADVATLLGYAPATANDHHTYNNDGTVGWAEDLTYIGHVNNSTATVAEMIWNLPAGQYSFALGSNATSNDANRQGYRATLTTVAPVPEPATGIFAVAAAAGLLVRRRRIASTAQP